jgi:hypothetical protein
MEAMSRSDERIALLATIDRISHFQKEVKSVLTISQYQFSLCLL